MIDEKKKCFTVKLLFNYLKNVAKRKERERERRGVTLSYRVIAPFTVLPFGDVPTERTQSDRWPSWWRPSVPSSIESAQFTHTAGFLSLCCCSTHLPPAMTTLFITYYYYPSNFIKIYTNQSISNFLINQ